MRIVILTTETTHHAFFVREMAKYARIQCVLVETGCKSPPFETAHPYESQREQYERHTWFGGNGAGVGEFAEIVRVASVNDECVTRRLRGESPDAVFVFGAGRLNVGTIEACGRNVLNLHGGDPTRYRGLDSHLWSIYHRDFGALMTALHRVSPQLDRGDIVELASLPIKRNLELYQLRAVNTRMCVQVCRNAIDTLRKNGSLDSKPQAAVGRYYSHMPAVLKSLCVERFAAYTRSLA